MIRANKNNSGLFSGAAAAAAMLAVLFPYYGAEASGRKFTPPKTVDECIQTRGPGSNGFMPRGVTDDNLEEYQQKYRCQSSSGLPIDENTCQQVLDNLRKTAKELNKLVKENCDFFVNQILAKDENSPERQCLKAHHQKRQGGEEITQQVCNEEAEKLVRQARTKFQEFRAMLDSFSKVMVDVKNLGSSISTEIVRSIDETAANRNTPVFTQPGHPTAQRFGKSTLAETDAFNRSQDPKVAAALLQEFKDKFEKADYSGVSMENYNQTFQPIEQAWRHLDSNVKSPILKEHLHNYLNAEEIRLATELYKNQLAVADRNMERIAETTRQNVNGLETAGRVAAAAPAASQAYSPSSTPVPTGASPGTAPRRPASVSVSPSDGLETALGAGAGGRGEQRTVVAKAGDRQTGAEEEVVLSSTAASRMADPSKKLRDSLRKRLAEKLGTSGATEVSEAAAAAEGSGPKTGDAMAALKELGGESEAGRLLKGAFGSLEEQALTGFGGELEGERFGIGGSTTDATIKAMIQEFENSVQASPHGEIDIGGTDGPSLFIRVREFHGRCLKKGCVVGLARGESQ